MIFRITVYRHGANPIIMPHGHQAVPGAGAVRVWAEMPARSVTSEVCPVSRGSWQGCVTLSPVLPSLPAEPKMGEFGFALQSLKDRLWKEGNQSENGNLPSSGSVPMDQSTATAPESQFGAELSFRGAQSHSVDKEPLHSFTQVCFGPISPGRNGEESWELRGALRAQFGAFFLHMTHDAHSSKGCESTKADSSPNSRGTPEPQG